MQGVSSVLKVFVSLIITLGLSLPAFAAKGLASHSAVYEITLKSAKSSSGITDLSGRMAIRFDNLCDSYTYEQRIVTDVVGTDGQARVNDFLMSAWETRDGSAYRFSHVNRSNGEIFERIEGSAEQTGGTTGGNAVFTQPEASELDFKKSVVFPMRHVNEILEAARAGKRIVTTQVFDETSESKLLEAVAFISPVSAEKLAGKIEGDGADAFKGSVTWNVHLSYYVAGQTEELPDYEVSFLVNDQGIAADLTMNYGDFAMQANLSDLTLGETPTCD